MLATLAYMVKVATNLTDLTVNQPSLHYIHVEQHDTQDHQLIYYLKSTKFCRFILELH